MYFLVFGMAALCIITTEPEFVNLLRSPGFDSQPGGSVQQPYLTYRPVRLYIGWRIHSWNRLLGSILQIHIHNDSPTTTALSSRRLAFPFVSTICNRGWVLTRSTQPWQHSFSYATRAWSHGLLVSYVLQLEALEGLCTRNMSKAEP